MLTLLPAIWVVFYRKQEVPDPVKPLHIPLLEPITKHAINHPRIWVGGFVLWVVIALVGTPNFRFENNLENLFNRDVPATIKDRIYGHLESNTTPCVFLSDTLEDARSVRDAIQEEPLFANSIGIAGYISHYLYLNDMPICKLQTELIEQQQRLLQTFTMGPVQWALPAQQALFPCSINVAKAVEDGPP